VLAQAVRRTLELGRTSAEPAPARLDLKGLLEFAALGTIADMVPLRHVNRTLAWHGLRSLGTSARPGIRALAAQGDGNAGQGADRVGFHLGPRINAAGRVAEATTAFTLLTTDDPERALALAAQMELENNRRRVFQAEATFAALLQAALQEEREDAVVVADAAWHMGVVGIVAARVKDQFGVPAFVLAIGEDGMARGSGRSVPGYDLTVGLHACCADGLAERYGGHAFAAGITMKAENLPEFRKRLAAHVALTLPHARRGEELRIDAELSVPSLELAILGHIDPLEPFGKGNHKPLFLLRNVEVDGLSLVGKEKDWARGRFLEPGTQPTWARLGVAAFGPASAFAEVKRGDKVDAVVRLERNFFRGNVTLQATVQALRAAGSLPIATRAAGPHR